MSSDAPVTVARFTWRHEAEFVGGTRRQLWPSLAAPCFRLCAASAGQRASSGRASVASATSHLRLVATAPTIGRTTLLHVVTDVSSIGGLR